MRSVADIAEKDTGGPPQASLARYLVHSYTLAVSGAQRCSGRCEDMRVSSWRCSTSEWTTSARRTL